MAAKPADPPPPKHDPVTGDRVPPRRASPARHAADDGSVPPATRPAPLNDPRLPTDRGSVLGLSIAGTPSRFEQRARHGIAGSHVRVRAIDARSNVASDAASTPGAWPGGRWPERPLRLRSHRERSADRPHPAPGAGLRTRRTASTRSRVHPGAAPFRRPSAPWRRSDGDDGRHNSTRPSATEGAAGRMAQDEWSDQVPGTAARSANAEAKRHRLRAGPVRPPSAR